MALTTFYNTEWGPGREMQSTSNSLHSTWAPTPFLPGVKLSMKNNVCSTWNKISGPCLMLALESRGLSVLWDPRWHRDHQRFLFAYLRTHSSPQLFVLPMLCGRKRALHLHFHLFFKVLPHKARKSEGNESKFAAPNHCMKAKKKKINRAKSESTVFSRAPFEWQHWWLF